MKRLSHFDGLRGVLAFWVFVQHWLQASGYRGSADGTFIRLLTSAGYAVHVFIMLSGFVIAYLLYESRENYRDYITRRFFRLYPVFIVCLLASILTFNLPLVIEGMLPASPWGNFPELVKITNNTAENLAVHVGMHLTMLHGLLPDQVLPSSAVAFLPPAWSISLEWQFYLVAPLFLHLLLRGTASRWLLAALIGGLMYLGSNMGTWFAGGFLGTHLHLFFLGVAGFALFRSMQASTAAVAGNILIISAFGMAFAPVFINKWPLIPYVIWFYMVGVTLLSGQEGNKVAFVGEWFLNLPICQYLGKISYSLYLWHWPILLSLQYFLLQSFDIEARGQMALMLGALSIPIALTVSILSYHFIEEPGIRFGKKIVNSRNPNMAVSA
ncbi:MAG: hypothetical protein CMN84_09185 [Spongiibacteraceae bacterium]|jgi:peptidoglycan/LPS O-acetylase OafA/YrhL|nr:hypothetical protein [Spongiibacteraceae bacterium]